MSRKKTPPAKVYLVGTETQLIAFERIMARYIMGKKRKRETGVEGRYKRYYDLSFAKPKKACIKPPEVVE